MPLAVDFKKQLLTRSERVKSVDFHPSEPLILSALYSGSIQIHDYEAQKLVKNMEICRLPCRCAKFIPRKQWVVAASDDAHLRVFNYNTAEKVKSIEAHQDFIRFIAIHPTLSYLLTASDDMTVKLWDFDNDMAKIQSFEGHAHYVMMCAWNPRDAHIFATASLDRTIKVWGILSSGSKGAAVVTSPHFCLTGHDRGVNCIDYSHSGERPYIVSGSDDKTVRVWDYQTKQCIQVLRAHEKNVTSVVFLPSLPLILSGAEDNTIKLWHSTTYRLEASLNYLMERVWSVATLKGLNVIGVGCDEGIVVLRPGGDKPVASLHNGKVTLAKSFDLQILNLKLVDFMEDGDRLPIPSKELGSCEIYPQHLSHHPSGRFFAVTGDGEFLISTAQVLRTKAHGKGTDFVWAWDGGYAARDADTVTIWHNFTEHMRFTTEFTIEELYGGRLLGLKSTDFVCFYDWHKARLVRRIDVCPKLVSWNDNGTMVIVASTDCIYVLGYDQTTVTNVLGQGDQIDPEEGIEGSFDLLEELSYEIDNGMWIADSFIFITTNLRLQLFTAGQVEVIAFLERPLHLLGYLPDVGRLFLIGRDLFVVSYQLHVAFLRYQNEIYMKDFAAAEAIFPEIPPEFHDRVARYLDHQGYKEKALEVAVDVDYRFELAISLRRLQTCVDIVKGSIDDEGVADRWKRLGDLALESGKIELATGCFKECKDASGMMLVATSTGDAALLEEAAKVAEASSQMNVAVTARLLLGQSESCVDLLIKCRRVPEAALLARTYCPKEIPRIVALWRQHLLAAPEGLKEPPKAMVLIAKNIASNVENPELFEAMPQTIKNQEAIRAAIKRDGPLPACAHEQYLELLKDWDMITASNSEEVAATLSRLRMPNSSTTVDLLDAA